MSRAISEILIIGIVVTAIAGISGYYSLMSQVGTQNVSLKLADHQLSKVSDTTVLVSVTLKNEGTLPVKLWEVRFDDVPLFVPGGLTLNPGFTWSDAKTHVMQTTVNYGDVHTIFVLFEVQGTNMTKAFPVRVSI